MRIMQAAFVWLVLASVAFAEPFDPVGLLPAVRHGGLRGRHLNHHGDGR